MPNEFHRQLANRILLYVRSTGAAPGDHLTEATLVDLLGTSRAPIRGALAYLGERGVVRRVPNKGYYLLEAIRDQLPLENNFDDRDLYLEIADDRLTGRLPDTVSENDLMRRFDASRAEVRRALVRIAQEGWVHKREGRGWTFSALIDSVEAYRESYALRQMLEPAGLASTSFAVDWNLFDDLARQQKMVNEGGWKTLTQTELFETNARFHEGLAAMSGNRFLLSVVEQQNQLRRLVEYRQTLHRKQVLQQNREHLAILAKIGRNDLESAARLLSEHLSNAANKKARRQIFESTSSQSSPVVPVTVA